MDKFLISDKLINFFNSHPKKVDEPFISVDFVTDLLNNSMDIFGCEFNSNDYKEKTNKFTISSKDEMDFMTIFYDNNVKIMISIKFNRDFYFKNYLNNNLIYSSFIQNNHLYQFEVKNDIKNMKKYDIIFHDTNSNYTFIFSKDEPDKPFSPANNIYSLYKKDFNLDNIVINEFTKFLLSKDVSNVLQKRDGKLIGSYLKYIENEYGKQIHEFTQEEQFYIMLKEN